MAEQTPLVRQWIVLKTLSARRHGVTVAELAQELSVHEKTIRRDLETFQQAGFPLDEEVGEHGRKSWRLRHAGGSPEIAFAFDEALALYLGRRFLDPLAGTYLWQAAQNAFKKVRACLGPAALAYLDKMAGGLHHTQVGASDYSQQADLIDELLRGVEERKATHLVYQSLQATEPVTYEVHPYGLAYHRGSLYLIAWSRDHDEVRTFKVDRVREVEVSAFPFHRPEDFDLERYLSGSFGIFRGDGEVRVVVRFAPAVARYVSESRWHASQELQPQADGSVRAEFQLSSTEEIMRWLLGFGRHAVVLEPDELREALRAEAAAVAAHYAAPAGRARS